MFPCKRRGLNRNGSQRFKCLRCGTSYTEEQDKILGTMTVPEEKALMALQLLIEGTSIRATERLTGLHRDTICRLLVVAGEKCETLLTEDIQALRVKNVEADEIWSYVGKKENNKRDEERENDMLGDSYCFVGMGAKHEASAAMAPGPSQRSPIDSSGTSLLGTCYECLDNEESVLVQDAFVVVELVGMSGL